MSDSRRVVFRICACALVAALYAALTVILAPFSYGPIQCRVSEVLCILPYFAPVTCWGLTLGCLLSNLLTGSVPDVVFGSLATLLAALCTAFFGKRRHTVGNSVLACLMPVIFNGLIVGAIITYAYAGLHTPESLGAYLTACGWVALGEAAVMLLPGMAAIRLLPRYRFFTELIDRLN